MTMLQYQVLRMSIIDILSQDVKKKDASTAAQIVMLIVGSILSFSVFFIGNNILFMVGTLVLMGVIVLNIASRKRSNSLDILKERLSKGEITKEEFEDLKKRL